MVMLSIFACADLSYPASGIGKGEAQLEPLLQTTTELQTEDYYYVICLLNSVATRIGFGS